MARSIDDHNYRDAGMGNDAHSIVPSPRRLVTEYENHEEVAGLAREILAESERPPDAIDAVLPGVKAAAIDKLTSLRERRQVEKLRAEGEHFAQGQANYLAKHDAAVDDEAALWADVQAEEAREKELQDYLDENW